MAKQPENIELSDAEVALLRERIKNKSITDEDLIIFDKILSFMLWIQHQLARYKITANKLRQMIFGSKTEKNKKLRSDNEHLLDDKKASDLSAIPSDIASVSYENQELNADSDLSSPLAIIPSSNECQLNQPIESDSSNGKEIKPKGHGRMRADQYKPDEIIYVRHTALKAGDPCPTECGGKLYQPNDTPGGIIRVIGQPCAHIIRYEFDRLRCSLCGDTFVPEAPPDFPPEKYDPYFRANLVIQKYFMASPFYRQERYQKLLGFRLPDSTQWDLVESVADCAHPVFNVLEKMAANGTHMNHDDTTVRILDVMRANNLDPQKKRKGMYTTCIFAQAGEYNICLYYSGIKHGGENISAVLEKRVKDLPPIIQMCDALSANVPATLNTILCHCLTHGRRKFTDIETFFPQECSYVIEQLALVYKHDAETKEKGMTSDERLAYHQTHSAPVMDALKVWMQRQFDERTVEPNSALGSAIRYMQKHWAELTRFLSVSGAHIDNNLVERALKLAIRTRKNAMFHKSLHSAFVASLLLTLIATCELAGQNPVHYLIALQKYKSDVFKHPDLWLPWNYESTLINRQKLVA